ncbi:MAG: UDP-N-acetylmuramoyl-L-alanine--D-glutamate ligase, partial [Anaerolineaceae bacterium]|nr:UDP-N-acetylmuramoyl-L-alanine--D-glutamate ligase [Anaerolineaceae bacterium]
MTDWNGKKVVMIGAARQGLALSRYLTQKGAKVTLNDRREDSLLADARQELSDLDITWVTGGHPFEILDGANLVCLSGGVPLDMPLVLEAENRGIPLSNDSQIFLEAAPCPVIGITGSAGKSTTTALVGEIAKLHFQQRKPNNTAWVGGNIGNPLIKYLDQMKEDDIAVMELSSFQLEIMTKSPHIAVILNLTPNHLDRHKTMAAYTSAKAHILTHQGPDDIAILNRDDIQSRKIYNEVKGRLITFGLNEPYNKQDATFYKRSKLYLQASGQIAKIIKADQINLPGTHNLYNILAAIAISAAASFSMQAIYEGITSFTGIAHRLEFVREWGGADWYNDSIATAPERAIAAINSFDRPIVLLAGGRDKDLPWEKFADLVHQKVDHLVIFGETVDLISNAVGEVMPEQRPFTIDRCAGLEEAVKKAAERVEPGDIVLLSPGGTSFDEFFDFEERGKRFTQWVKELT